MTNKITIPESFELSRVKWKVNHVEYLGTENLGECNNNTCIIQLPKYSQRNVIEPTKIINTFYHELAHAMLDTLEYVDLSGDEKFVTALGSLIMEFDLTRNNSNIECDDLPMET